MAQPRWRLLGFLCLAAALNYADRAAFSSVLAPLRTDLGLSDTALGLLSSLFLWSYALASLAAGMLADRYSRSLLVLVSLVCWSLVTVLTGLANGLIMLATLRIALGLAESLYLPAAIALLADHHGPRTRGRAMGLHSVALNFGVVVGGALAGYAADHYGWRVGFFVLGSAGMAMVLGTRWAFPAAAANVTAIQRPALAEVGRYLARVPTFHLLLLKNMFGGFAVWIFLNWLPLYFREMFNLTLGSAGFTGTFALQVSYVIGLAAGGWISDALAASDARRRMLILAVCHLASSPILLMFLGGPGLGVTAAIIAAFSLLQGLGDASEKPALCEIIPANYRSTALGIMNACATATGGLGVFLVGFLKSSFSLNTMFAGLSAVLFCAGLAALFSHRFFMARDMVRAQERAAALDERSEGH